MSSYGFILMTVAFFQAWFCHIAQAGCKPTTPQHQLQNPAVRAGPLCLAQQFLLWNTLLSQRFPFRFVLLPTYVSRHLLFPRLSIHVVFVQERWERRKRRGRKRQGEQGRAEMHTSQRGLVQLNLCVLYRQVGGAASLEKASRNQSKELWAASPLCKPRCSQKLV